MPQPGSVTPSLPYFQCGHNWGAWLTSNPGAGQLPSACPTFSNLSENPLPLPGQFSLLPASPGPTTPWMCQGHTQGSDLGPPSQARLSPAARLQGQREGSPATPSDAGYHDRGHGSNSFQKLPLGFAVVPVGRSWDQPASSCQRNGTGRASRSQEPGSPLSALGNCGCVYS